MELEVSRLGQGTPQAPSDGSTMWYVLRAKSAGLSLLKAMRVAGCNEPAAAEAFYKDRLRCLKSGDDTG